MSVVADKRDSLRRRTIFGGVIFDDGGKSWECSVADISESGVRVRLQTDLEIGSFVELKINKFDGLRRCQVMWKRENWIGLRFEVKIDPDDDEMASLFKFRNPGSRR